MNYMTIVTVLGAFACKRESVWRWELVVYHSAWMEGGRSWFSLTIQVLGTESGLEVIVFTCWAILIL